MPTADRCQRKERSDVVDDPVRGRLRDPEQRAELPHGEVRPPVRGYQQYPVLQRQPPRPTAGRHTTTPAPHETYQLAELPLAQTCEQPYPARL